MGVMTTEEMRRAIEEPAQRGRWEFEPGLVELMLHDVGHEPGALPLLSHALFETWQRRRGRMMTLSGYAASGGVRGAIAETAETVFSDQFTSEQQAIARRVFLRLTELNDEGATADTRRRAKFDELILKPEEASATHFVLKTLADARLITTSEDSAEVAHEALIREWPTLQGWLEENREGLRLQRHLTEAAREWLEMNREPDMLYRGARLAQAREWASFHAEEMNALEREFLQASVEAGGRELAEKEAQRQREMELQRQRAEEQTQAEKKLQRRAIFLTGALIIAGMLAATALLFSQRANQEARLSKSRELAAAAISNLDIDPERSMLLALEAVSTAHTLEAEDALHKAVTTSRVQRTIDGHDAQIWSVAFSPDGTKLASASQDGTAKVWDSASGKELLVFQGHGAVGINSIAFSPDGNRVATGDDNGRVKVWDMATGQELLTLSDRRSLVLDVVFSPDGQHLATARSDRTAIVWDAWTGKKLFTLQGHTDELVHVFFSPDGNRLSTASLDETVKVWDAKTGEELLTMPGLALALSPDGTRLATVSDNLVINIFDITSGDILFRLRGHTNNLTSAAFSPDGRLLVTTSLDTKAIVWDVSTGLDLLTLSGHIEDITTAAFSPDGIRLATASQDGIIKIWNLTPGHELPGIFHPPGNTSWFALSPDGKHLVMIGEFIAVPEVWSVPQKVNISGDAERPQRILTLEGHEDYVRALAYSPDGSRIATGSRDRTAKLWDAATGRELHTMTTPSGVAWVAFSPDGSRIATGGADGATRIWSTETGENLSVFRGQHVVVLNATFNPEGTHLATGIDDGMARIWDLATGKQLFILSHPGAVYGVAFSPDGKRLATASSAAMIKLWNASSGKELLSFTGHADSIVSIAFSPDGTRLATASRDGTAKLWDAASGRALLTLQGGGVGICCVAFSSDGNYLFTGGDNGVHAYALRIEDLVRLARSRLTRSLATEECQKYLHVQECPARP
jgi:WD40 repeat protein